MSDWRKPTETLRRTISLPGNKGKKSIQIDMFPATMFKDKCRPWSKWKVFPTIRISSKLNYLYRIKIDGRWHKKERYNYYFLTKDEVWEILRNA